MFENRGLSPVSVSALALLLSVTVAVKMASAAGTPPDIYGQLSQEQRDEADQFAVQNAIATVFHEAGHMLVSEFDLPVLGREEDAVDGLAAMLLLEADDEDMNSVVEDFANVWFMSAEAYEDLDDSDFLDTHGLDEQRAYNTVCMMVGKNPERFGEFADDVNFPPARRADCAAEYRQLVASWTAVLEPHAAGQGQETKFVIRYEKVSDPKLRYFRDKIRQEGVLEIVADLFSGTYDLKDGIKLTADECGEANAYWDADGREMTLCYEDLVNSAELDAQWYVDNPDE